MTTSTIVIDAVITTQAPLCIKMPTPQNARDNGFDQFPIMTRGIDPEGKPLQTGYLPATTLRGFMRRAIVTDSMTNAAVENKHYTLQQAYAELIGQDAGSDSGSGQMGLLEQQKIRSDNPVLDLFGSGLSLKSRLLVSHFLPVLNVLPERFSGVRKDIEDTPDAFEALLPDTQAAYANRSQANSLRSAAASQVKDIVRKLAKARKSGASADDIRALDEQLMAAKLLESKYETEMGNMQNSSRTVLEHTALAAGIELHGQLIVERARDRDMNMLKLALNALSNRPILGGHAARGCGEISGKFTASINGEVREIINIGGWKNAVIITV